MTRNILLITLVQVAIGQFAKAAPNPNLKGELSREEPSTTLGLLSNVKSSPSLRDMKELHDEQGDALTGWNWDDSDSEGDSRFSTPDFCLQEAAATLQRCVTSCLIFQYPSEQNDYYVTYEDFEPVAVQQRADHVGRNLLDVCKRLYCPAETAHVFTACVDNRQVAGI